MIVALWVLFILTSLAIPVFHWGGYPMLALWACVFGVYVSAVLLAQEEEES